MLPVIRENSTLIQKLLKETINAVEAKRSDTRKLEANNETLTTSLNSICEILNQHKITRISSNLNIALGQTIQSIQTHTPIIIAIQNVFKSFTSDTKSTLFNTLEASVN